jgi:hypothetical protein
MGKGKSIDSGQVDRTVLSQEGNARKLVEQVYSQHLLEIGVLFCGRTPYSGIMNTCRLAREPENTDSNLNLLRNNSGVNYLSCIVISYVYRDV